MTNFTYTYQEVEIVSDVSIKNTERNVVWFTDGSVADLEDMAIKNVGTGNIRFRFKDKVLPNEVHNKKISFQNIHELYVKSHNISLDFEVVLTDDTPEVELVGNEDFLSSVQVKQFDGALYINRIGIADGGPIVSYGRYYINGKKEPQWEEIEGKVIVRVNNMLPSLKISSNHKGSGLVECPVGSVVIDNSGSQELELQSVEKLHAQITGSSKVNIGKLINNAGITISGSGDVNIFSGEAKELVLMVSGSGNICANVVAQIASVTLTGSGSVIIGQVMEESRELHGGSGAINILKRGI